MSLNRTNIDTYGKRGNRIGGFDEPFACMSDCKDTLLIADRGNNRLQLTNGRQWSMLLLKPPQGMPSNYVYDGKALYVVQRLPNALMKYE